MDVEIFNYSDVLFTNFRSGKLEDIVSVNKIKTAGKGAGDEIDTGGFNAGVSVLMLKDQPAGVQFKRNNSDFMNNFYVDIVCRSFTNIEDIHRASQENQELNK